MYGIVYQVKTTVNSLPVSFNVMTAAGVEDDGLANASDDGTGICEVCHTDTSVFKNNASGAGGRTGGHETKLGACVDCHPHTDGFKGGGSCLSCHNALKGAVGPGTDYRRIVGGKKRIGRSLTGRPVEAVWDPELAPAMRAAGRAVHEEQVIETLLTDLSTAPRRRASRGG